MLPLPNYPVVWHTAHAHPHATDAAMYTALFKFHSINSALIPNDIWVNTMNGVERHIRHTFDVQICVLNVFSRGSRQSHLDLFILNLFSVQCLNVKEKTKF